jgi:hypothetical protein
MTATRTLPTFREVQRPTQWWIWAIVGAVVFLTWAAFIWQVLLEQPLGTRPAPDWAVWLIWLTCGVGLPLFLGAHQLKVETEEEQLSLHFAPLYRCGIPYDQIRRCEAITYRPILHYGGWGLRWAPGRGWAYSVSGNRGVRLTLSDGREFLIGSQAPEELARAIGKRMS